MTLYSPPPPEDRRHYRYEPGVWHVHPPRWIPLCDHQWEPIMAYDDSQKYGDICATCGVTRMQP